MSIASANREQQERADRRDKWDRRFMRVAEQVATWSKDPGTHVGAVLVRSMHNVILSTGYNGLPRAMQDRNLTDRDSKLSRTVHAEMNAVMNAGLSLSALHEPITLYTTLFPCDRCAVHLIQSGVSRVVVKEFPTEYSEKLAEWRKVAVLSNRYFAEAGVEVQTLLMDDSWRATADWIMQIYDEQIAKGGSADQVIVNTVRAALAAPTEGRA